MSKLIFVICLFIIFGFLFRLSLPDPVVQAKPIPTPITIPTPSFISDEKLMALVNDWRISQGFHAYTQDDLLCRFAEKRIPEIELTFSHKYFLTEIPHFFPTEKRSYIAENLAEGYSDEQEALTAWLNSPEHRKNLDTDYRYSCLKCDNNYCVEIFANYE